MSYPPEGPCEECGAMVGHRVITLEPIDGTSGHRACSLGMDVVPRAEHERVKEVYGLANDSLWDALIALAQDRNAYLVNLTSTQSRCTELLEEVRALRMANDWRDGLRNGPQSALDILGIDRDRWKARAIAAEKKRDEANRRLAEIPSGDTEEVRALRVERDGLVREIVRLVQEAQPLVHRYDRLPPFNDDVPCGMRPNPDVGCWLDDDAAPPSSEDERERNACLHDTCFFVDGHCEECAPPSSETP